LIYSTCKGDESREDSDRGGTKVGNKEKQQSWGKKKQREKREEGGSP